jgi:hypothetical protein
MADAMLGNFITNFLENVPNDGKCRGGQGYGKQSVSMDECTYG